MKISEKISMPTERIFVKLGDMRVSSTAQRKLMEGRVKQMAKNFDLEKIGVITVSYRDGAYWIIDGQHRFYALKEYLQQELGDDAEYWIEWPIEVDTYYGLSEKEEAEKFLDLNEAVNPNALDRFKVSVKAGKSPAVEINKVVEDLGLRVNKSSRSNCIGAVTALQSVYKKGDTRLLIKVLSTIKDAWGGVGFEADIIRGLGVFYARYDNQVSETRLVGKLSKVHNSYIGLRNSARLMKDRYDTSIVDATAAVITDLYNQQLAGGSKARLTSWWKYDAGI